MLVFGCCIFCCWFGGRGVLDAYGTVLPVQSIVMKARSFWWVCGVVVFLHLSVMVLVPTGIWIRSDSTQSRRNRTEYRSITNRQRPSGSRRNRFSPVTHFYQDDDE